MQNPPLTPFEARQLAGLEAWAKQTANAQNDKRRFAELVYFQTKLAKFLRQRSELEVQIYLPSGQVFCRKKLPVMITDDEVAVVKRELAKAGKANCMVDRKGKELIIHEPISMGNIPGAARVMRPPFCG